MPSTYPSCSPNTLPSVIQDTVGDKQLAQKVPDVSVGPVLGGQRQSRVTNTPPPTSTQERAYPGSFAPLASEGGPATKLSGTSCSMYANQ